MEPGGRRAPRGRAGLQRLGLLVCRSRLCARLLGVDRVQATVTAARVGTWFGYGLITFGVLAFISGVALSGLWFVFLGWFLFVAARGGAFLVTEQAALAGRKVHDVMSPNPATTSATASVQELIDDYVMRYRHSSFPVVRSDGSVVGLVTLDAVRFIPLSQRSEVTLETVAYPLTQVPVVGPDDPADALVPMILGGPGIRALVFEGGDPNGPLVGIVSARDLLRLMHGSLLVGR